MSTVTIKTEATLDALIESLLIAVVRVPDRDLHLDYARQLRHAAVLLENRLDDRKQVRT